MNSMSDEPSDEFLLVATSEDAELAVAPDRGQKGGWGSEVRRDGHANGLQRLRAADLEQKMSHFLQMVGRLFRQAERQAQQEQTAQLAQTGAIAASQLRLDEVELSVEITAGGEIKLIAGGAKADAKGAIKLKFKRVEKSNGLAG
jgi:hypothetical protein